MMRHLEEPSFITPGSSRLAEVIDERVFNFAHSAQRHFKTNDPIVILDLRVGDPGFEAAPRESFAQADGLSPEMKLKFYRPADDFKEVLGAPGTSFWFLAIFEDGDSASAAIDASMHRCIDDLTGWLGIVVAFEARPQSRCKAGRATMSRNKNRRKSSARSPVATMTAAREREHVPEAYPGAEFPCLR